MFFMAVYATLVSAAAFAQLEPEDDEAGRGKDLFDRTCSVCHGLNGEGQGELGFKLTSRQAVLWSDETLIEKIAYGNLTIGMPRFGPEFAAEGLMTDFGSFDEAPDIKAIVAYIRVLQRRKAQAREAENGAAAAPSIPASGDSGRGRALFMGKARCAECHAVAGEGGKLGPDLTGIAEDLGRDAIYQAIVAPSRTVRAGYRMKELNFGRGKVVRGVYRNETSTTIEILDRETGLWAGYDKSSAQFYRPLRASPMPDGLLDALTDEEVIDLLMFLDSLK